MVRTNREPSGGDENPHDPSRISRRLQSSCDREEGADESIDTRTSHSQAFPERSALRHDVRKRFVKSPKVYVRDSGLVHALLGIDSHDTLAGHPVAGASWEGFVIENLLAAAPPGTAASFYRTRAGAEIDLVMELPGGRATWAVEIKLGLVPGIGRGFHYACEDVAPERAFIVCSGDDRYPLSNDVEVIGLREMAGLLRGA